MCIRAQPSDLRSLLSEAYTYYQQPRLRTETATHSFSSDGQSGSALVPAGRLQDGIRQLYGKGAARGGGADRLTSVTILTTHT